MNNELHAHTPSLNVMDGRGLPVREVAFHRLLSADPPTLRITRHSFNPVGRKVTSQDPRLTSVNIRTVYSLSGQVLLTESVDAGWRLALLGEAGQWLDGWDGRSSHRQVEYDNMLRPLVIRESSDDPVGARLPAMASAQPEQVVERFTYGGPDAAEHNQCNQPTRHDDTAGTLRFADYSLLGSALSEQRQFLRALESPDWPLSEAERDALLEADSLQTQWVFNALGETLEQTDAMGNRQHFSQTVAGQLKSVSLTLAGAAQTQMLVSDIRYNAFDQVEQETAGNGVISDWVYDPQNGRLTELSAILGQAPALQHLRYSYDPVGNIEQIEDLAQPVRFFANQRVEATRHYRYDTLYQLIEASGREVNTATSHGPTLPDLQSPPAPNQLANYTQHYEYDAGGNLLQMRHVGAQPFTRSMRVAPSSNRSLPADEVDVDFDTGFDANGNSQQLVRGQDLSWDRRNQLRHLTTVQRENGLNDGETYIYDGNGQRCRKISSARASGRPLINEVRYLPGLEIRSSADDEILHVINAPAGRNNVRVLHWQTGKPGEVSNDQVRYSLNDHLGSSTLELDAQGALISQESYYPFGGTSWWAARSEVEAKYKTVRYSGKERDASGLYYYGFRYFAPWLQRWISADPAGITYGLNVFCFVDNSPVQHADKNGQFYEGQGDITEYQVTSRGINILARGLQQFPYSQFFAVKSALKETTNYLQSALTMIKNHPDESADTMRNYFGYEHASVTPKIIDTWERTHRLAAEYNLPQNAGKFVSTDNKFAAGQVYPRDPHGRIFIGNSSIKKPALPITIGHELSHLSSASNITTTGPRTKDYYYLFLGGFKNMTRGFRTPLFDTPYRNTSEMIVGGGLSHSYFSLFPEQQPFFIAQVDAFQGGHGTTSDIHTAISTFNRNPQMIADFSSKNADSLVHAARDLHERYQQIKHLKKNNRAAT